MSAPWPILLATVQPKATTLAFTKPNQQVVTFFMQILARGDAASSVNSKFQGDTQHYTVVKQATVMIHRCRYQNK